MSHEKNLDKFTAKNISRRRFFAKFLKTSFAVPFFQNFLFQKAYAQFFTASFWKKRSNIVGGSLWGFGLATSGEIGDNSAVSKSSPTQVGALTNWLSLSSSVTHSLAVKTDGTLWAWGLNTNGRLGDGSTTTRSSPVQIGTLTNWSKVSAGPSNSIAIKTDGSLWVWGWDRQELSEMVQVQPILHLSKLMHQLIGGKLPWEVAAV